MIIFTLCMIFFASIFTGCNNFFHDLIPPDGNLITSFTVNGQADDAVITGNSVTLTVQKGIDIHALIPRITVSPRASIVPVTLDYVEAAFPGVDLAREALEMYQTNDLAGYVHKLIKETPGFNIPALHMPIDFSGPVSFFVISAQGTIRQYSVEVYVDDGEPRLMGLRFAKYDNPELVSDAGSLINEANRSITVRAMYPAEMDSLSFALIPSFELLGDSLELDGLELVSGETLVQFDPVMGTQNRTLRVYRNETHVDYALVITFTEDPDTIRSITDFRFVRADNPGIATTAVASIVNNDNAGTITVQVLHSGTRPSVLVPRFVSPGTVSMDGVQQSTGDSHDFSSPLEYRVVSRNGQYTRTYTVRTEFINLVTDAPRITSFRFNQSLNNDLVQDTEGEIGDGFIMIDARYASLTAPETLVPEFSAQGIVKVSGSVQVSGGSPQNFSRQIRYTVENPENPLLTREYWVQTRLVRNTSSDASITAFGFYPEDNPGLADALDARIDQGMGRITVFAPISSGVTSRVMVPRFSALGQVSVGGVVQSSGSSGLLFDGPVTYTVVSANGLVSRDYEVTVRELTSTIYVNYNAWGDNDGTSWAHAFRSLQDACEAAVQFPDDVPKEIWIAAGTYKPGTTTDDYFPLTPNTSYIGGFAGWETAKNQRDTAANVTVISGYLESTRSYNLFGRFSGNNAVPIFGTLMFDELNLTGASAQGSDSRAQGAAINVWLGSGAELFITNCTFTDLQANDYGGAVYLFGSGNVEFSGCTLDTIYSRSAINNFGNRIKIGSSVIKNASGEQGIYSSTGMEIDGLELRNITGVGISISGGTVDLSGIDAYNISGMSVFAASSIGITVRNSIFDTGGHLYFVANSPLQITNTKIFNVHSGLLQALLVRSSDNTIIEGVTIDGVPTGRGIDIDSSGIVRITDSVIKNCINTGNGGGIALAGTGSSEISNTTIENTEAHSGGAIYSSHSLVISGSTIRNVTANTATGNGGGIALAGTGSSEISDTTIENAEAHSGGAIHSFNRSLTISDSTIRNVKAIRGGGAITLSNSTGSNINCEINNTTIENAEAAWPEVSSGNGGAIASYDFNLIISGSTIRNVSSLGNGGGIYLSGGVFEMNHTVIENAQGSNGGAIGVWSLRNMSISNSRFEQCRGFGGAIFFSSAVSSGGNFTITDTDFIDCTGAGIYKMFATMAVDYNYKGTFIRCNFEHTDALFMYPPNDLHRALIGLQGEMLFEDCTFTNLRGGNTGEQEVFCFNRNYQYPLDLTLRNCIFNFGPGLRMGIATMTASVGGQPPDSLLMDGVQINNAGSQPVLISLSGAVPNAFRFRLNNVYEGTVLDNELAIGGLVGSGLIRLQGGAVPVIVP